MNTRIFGQYLKMISGEEKFRKKYLKIAIAGKWGWQ